MVFGAYMERIYIDIVIVLLLLLLLLLSSTHVSHCCLGGYGEDRRDAEP